jgi:hypothetical protein
LEKRNPEPQFANPDIRRVIVHQQHRLQVDGCAQPIDLSVSSEQAAGVQQKTVGVSPAKIGNRKRPSGDPAQLA